VDFSDFAILKHKDAGTRMGNGKSENSPAEETRPKANGGRKALSRFSPLPTGRKVTFKEEAFHSMLTLERRRAERSGKPFILMLLDSHGVHKNGNGATFIHQLATIVSNATRETDIVGWYEDGEILAVIFTEVNLEGTTAITEILHSKVVTALRENLDQKLASGLVVTLHLFPESLEKGLPDHMADIKLYPDLSEKSSKRKLPMALKRAIDIVGSALMLAAMAPILGIIAAAIKLSSKGPILFKQERLGRFGKTFNCLKFRTMYADNDPRVHREFVQRFIAGAKGAQDNSGTESGVYKITNDPRVTPIGRFLRSTSLDEFPQFWNVLRGEMSLVGPRPPLRYEFEVYDYWHRRRVLEVKPGVTGLWQVSGRSRTCFDDMVRLDLQYTQGWSLWLDVKILLATPGAVFNGDGAF
jgi:lipopolysaccharide/colanic/teichoic acid biosynthesis glycosyltransferase